jgi:hypothetical protein
MLVDYVGSFDIGVFHRARGGGGFVERHLILCL